MIETANWFKLVKPIGRLIPLEFSDVHQGLTNDRPIHLVKPNNQPLYLESYIYQF
jgi:hypothetical protein